MKDPIETLWFCERVVDSHCFEGDDSDPSDVRELLPSAIRAAEAEIDRLRRELAEARAAAQPSSNLPRASSAGAMGVL